jgi:hypothetical protein
LLATAFHLLMLHVDYVPPFYSYSSPYLLANILVII